MRLVPALLLLTLAGPALAEADPGTLQQHDTFRDAATAPLEDLNLKRKSIPPVLARAVTDPYDLTGLTRRPTTARAARRSPTRPMAPGWPGSATRPTTCCRSVAGSVA